MKTQKELVSEQCKILASHIPTCFAMAVVNVDGLSMGAWNPRLERYGYNVEEDRLSAMSAAMISLGERIVSEMRCDTLKMGVQAGDKGFTFLVALGEEYVLTFLVRELRTIDITLTILQQRWDELLKILNVEATEFYNNEVSTG